MGRSLADRSYTGHYAPVPMLESPGVFTMLVPEGWSATGFPDGKYELTRAGAAGTANLSVYDRQDAPVTEAEARVLMTGFLAMIKPLSEPDVVVLAEGDDQHRAVARCSDGNSEWLVFLVLWRQHFVMCSCTAEPGSPLLAETEKMFATNHRPEQQRKRFWRK